jgi:hypothetical protein
LDPAKQLTISRHKRARQIDVAIHRVRRSNSDQASSCHRLVIGTPLQKGELEGPRLLEKRPVLRFNVGPGYTVDPDVGRSR